MYWFDAYDRMALQYLLISIITLISLFVIPSIFKPKEIKQAILDPLSLIFAGYLFFAILSMTASINIVESFVRLGQLGSFYLSLLIILLIAKQKLININFILYLLLITLILDVVMSLGGYYLMYKSNIPYSYSYINNLLGLFGNRNLLSVAILFRLPLLFLLALRLNKVYFYIPAFILTAACFFNLFLLSSRTALLTIILCLGYFLILLFYRLIKSNTKLLSLNRGALLLFILPLLIAYYISTNVIVADDYGNVNTRIASIASTEDESKNRRLLFYGHTINNFKENPLFGCGLGNWRILSIKYDSENMENYVVPYNAHNDILEALTETGIFGGILFAGFFILLFYLIFKGINFNSQNLYDYSYMLFAPMPFIVYFVDLNLNFPSYRPFNQWLLLFFIIIIYISNSRVNEKQ